MPHGYTFSTGLAPWLSRRDILHDIRQSLEPYHGILVEEGGDERGGQYMLYEIPEQGAVWIWSDNPDSVRVSLLGFADGNAVYCALEGYFRDRISR